MKKIEDLDYYDLLSVRVDATPMEIETAYLLAVATYHAEALASHGALSPAEREVILDKIEEAFETLADPEKKRIYDSEVLPHRVEFQQRAYFRKSTEKVEIEDASEEERPWDKLRSAVLPPWRRRRLNNESGKSDGKDWLALQRSRYYYGEFLKKVREKRGLTLDDAARASGISSALLMALENEESDALPNGKERYRLLKSYAQSLGLYLEKGRE
jgi:curved DNA-binding protein CbpA